MKILAIGDVVGRVGRRALSVGLNAIVTNTKADFVLANAENLAGGFGFTRDTVEEMFKLGVDALTTGNHVWDKKEALDLLPREPRLLRPANFPEAAPGKGAGVFTSRGGVKVGVLNLQGRVFMEALDCPFRRAEAELAALSKETKIIIVDMHAEATSEKIAMANFLDGRVSAVVGTHTHVQTADARVFPRGTAYITDLGMTGPSHSIIGIQPEIILKRFLLKIPERFQEAHGPGQFNGALIEIDENTGLARSIKPIQSSYEFN